MSADTKPASPSPELSEWLSWSTEEVAQWIAALPRPVVMGWPFNGTRRWYLLHRRNNPDTEDYVTTLIRRQAEQHRLVFAHGVSTILAPSFGTELLQRGSTYARHALGGLLQLADDAVYQEMLAAGLRIRFYGDYKEKLNVLGCRPMLKACADLISATGSGNGPLLLIGLFADAPYPTIARLSVEFAEQKGRPPNRQELIEAYYGCAVPDLTLYLGFAQPALFDIPLLTTGEEDLYATLTPSPSLTEKQLREILYDNLITRRTAEGDYEVFSDEAQAALAEYNDRYTGVTLGIGSRDPLTGIWNPLLPSVAMPHENAVLRGS
jgi:adenosine tuberculosinyltransferase